MDLSNRLSALILALVFAFAGTASSQEGLTDEEAAERMRNFKESLELRTGEQSLPDANATLTLSDEFAFLDPEDTQRFLEEAWGNPPGQLTHGAIVARDFDPFGDEAWAVIIQYEEEGYVSDEDAAEMDYDGVLSEMQAAASESNEARAAQGYATIDLIGWAEPPYYNPETHKLYWAKEFSFDESPSHTLNYNIRALGRRGVLVMNAVGSMDQLSSIRSGMQDLLPMVAFEEGSRYVDFDPDVDTLAAYGIGALVAGKVAAKVGLLAKFAPALLVVKKFGVVALLVVGGFLKRFFGGGKDESSGNDSTPIA